MVCKTPCYRSLPFDSPQQFHLQNGHPGAQRTQLPILIKLVAGLAGTRRQAFQALSSGNTALHPELSGSNSDPSGPGRKMRQMSTRRTEKPPAPSAVSLTCVRPNHLLVQGTSASKQNRLGTHAISKGTAEPVRWLPKGPPRSSRAWNYAGRAGVASSNPGGADPRPPHTHTDLPWSSALGPTSSRAAGSWSRERAGVAGSGKFGVPWGKTAHLCKGWKGREGKQAPGTAH